MKPSLSRCFPALIFFACCVLSACGTLSNPASLQAGAFKLEKIFPTARFPSLTFNASIIASPVLDVSHGQPRLIVPVSDGEVAALDAGTGTLLWKLKVPRNEGQEVQLIATPVMIGDKLVVSYQCLEQGVRTRHQLAVIDLKNHRFDDRFPVLTVTAGQATADGKATVKFNPPTAYSHAALKHINRPGTRQGYVYAAYGNAADVQPFHGWVFEIDMDAWQQQGAEKAIKNVLLTTAEADCPVTMEYGTQEMVCGGGVWVPSGPLVTETKDDVDLFIPTGNGQVDLLRHDYANAVMRVKPGLQFDAGCDAQLCANFNPVKPDEACLASCKNLFIPRLAKGNAPIKPPYHECDDKDFWECLAWMDYDLGANTPVKIAMPDGREVLVQAGKDGGAYLMDAGHLGTQYDRLQVAPLCGSPTDLCKLSWAGMIVTQPVQTQVDGDPVVVIPAFSADQTHPSGVTALKIVLENGQPKFKPFWKFPESQHPEALKMFRSHPSFPVLTAHLGGQEIIWLVDIGTHGTLYGIRAKDGAMVAKQTLQGTGRQLTMPLIVGDKVYLVSKMPDTGKAGLEAYRIGWEIKR
ncbi:PQQ-binding-like beta-propeller repeat protein [Methylovulum miyakonense]|uniref:PQQ-binding-like beta-propeller repeat protein n=1 Tax=Methylovulum miyakonense TaxID=645578 RepID=UPI00035CC1F3|nr:PQQ-binding-like beta-propeller repeat protein [Methylovulum miyakonense]